MHLVTERGKQSRGLAEWLVSLWRGLGLDRRAQKRQMRVLETLTLGAKNKLVLVSYAGERYLVGTGADNVGTIVRVGAEQKGLGLVREMGL